MLSDEASSGVAEKYIIFTLGKELYGTPIRTIREVIEYQSAKPVPNTIDSFEGVINVRGEVMGALDLRRRFGIQGENPQCQFVVETEAGPLAVTVDRVESVSIIPEGNIQSHPGMVSDNMSEYLIGIGKLNNHLITLVDLAQLLSRVEIAK